MRESPWARGVSVEGGKGTDLVLFKCYHRLKDVNCCSVHISGPEIPFVRRSQGSFGCREVDDIISLMEHFIGHSYADEVNFLPLILVWDTNRDALHCRSGALLIDDGGINGQGVVDKPTRRWKPLPWSTDLILFVMVVRWRQVEAILTRVWIDEREIGCDQVHPSKK